MKLKAVSGIMLTLLLIGILTLVFNIRLVKSEATTIIVPDEYEKIQWAIGNASAGDTIFVRAGTYYENVVVDKTISLVGENRTTTVIDGNRTALKDTILVTSENVLIANLTIRNAYYSGVKLDFYSSYNTIADNNITNNDDGIVLQDSSKNKILYNNIENNTWNGILLINNEGEWGNEVIRNTIKNNHNGINSYDIDRVEANTFFHNNFINNKRQVIYYYSGYQDIWHSGYPSGGNYWSDYNGTDANHDGIGDTEHVIDSNNTDNYPLMGMFSDFTVWDNETYHITTICNFTISDFNWGYRMNITGTWEKALYFNVFGPEDTVGFCRIMIPRAFLEGPYTVLFTNEVNSTELPISNSTHVFLYITYNHSGQVMIVPEFPSLLIPPLFMIATLLAVIVYRRKHPA